MNRYVPSWAHDQINFRQRMKQYAKRVGLATQKKEKLSGTQHAVIAGKEMQSNDGTVWFPSTNQTTSPSLQNQGWSNS